MWLGDVETLAQDHRVHAVDIPGEPGFSEARRLALVGNDFAEWLGGLLDALGCERATLVGCSLGGWVALRLATLAPERIARLVLLCPSGVAPARVSFLFRALLLLPLGRWGQRRLNRIVWGGLPVPEDVERFATLILRHFRPRMGSLPVFGDEELSRLRMPTMLLAGARDALLPTSKTAARLGRLLPDVHLCVRPDAGHVLVDTAEPIRAFLAGAD